jgi:hypothetical protein
VVGVLVTGGEQADLNQFRHETREELAGFRTEIAGLRDDMAPAIRLAQNFDVAARALAGTSKVAKYAVGVGAGLGTILGVLRVFGIL